VTAPESSDPNARDLVRAIGALCGTLEEVRLTVHCAIDDSSAAIVESVRSAGNAIVAALAQRVPANRNVSWPETDSRFARANGGHVQRPVSVKTDAEKTNLARMRARKAKDGEQ
jgi:hypothetical protein